MKVNSRLHRSKKGVGTIIGVVMFLMISIFFVGGTFLWQTETQTKMNKLDRDRIDERFTVQACFYYDDFAGEYKLELKIKNVGTLDIKVVQVWIIDQNNNDHQHIDVEYPLQVGQFTYIAEIDTLTNKLTTPLDVYSITYYLRVVTERGNMATSLLVPRALYSSNWPAVIIPDASWVKKQGNKGRIHLEVWNTLDEELTIGLIVATRMMHGSEQSELIEVDWPLTPGEISVGEFMGEVGQVYSTGDRVFIELADIDGIVVSSYYFVCQ